MKITREQLENLLDKLDFWMNEDKKIKDAFNVFVEVIAPNSYVPIIEASLTQSFISGVGVVYPHLKDDLEYYAWELPSMETAEGKKKGKIYNLKNKEECINFLLDVYLEEVK